MPRDAQGHDLTGATDDAVGHYDRAIRAFTLAYGDTIGELDAARQASPDFTMAHLAKAWVLALANDAIMINPARDLLQAARALPSNDREKTHAAALTHAVEGHRMSAVRILDRHLMHNPTDLLALPSLLIAHAVGSRRQRQTRIAGFPA